METTIIIKNLEEIGENFKTLYNTFKYNFRFSGDVITISPDTTKKLTKGKMYNEFVIKNINGEIYITKKIKNRFLKYKYDKKFF